MSETTTDKVRAALECLSDNEFDWSADCGSQLSFDEWVLHKAQEALALLDGKAIVPVEPTDTQIHAGMEALKYCSNPDAYFSWENPKGETVYFSGAPSLQYRAMIAPYVGGKND